MIYDITQPLFECEVYPGDRRPERRQTKRIEKGDLYNLTELSLCAHNGTHVDAPYHFIENGRTIDEIPLGKFIGKALVTKEEGLLGKEAALRILDKAGNIGKILIKGPAVITEEAAEVFASAHIDLLGNESQTVGPEDAPMAVHLILLKQDIVLLEGIRLAKVPEGIYHLNCAPLSLSHSDGAPCRAVLTDYE